MGLTDLKFTETDFLNKKIADLSDTPNSDGMSAAELKAYFDYIPKTLIALTRLNSIIDIISGSSGAENVGASTITGVTGTNAQAILESLKSLIDLRYTKNETDNLLSFKATNETVSQLIKNVDFDEDTGKFTFTFESGNTKEIDTAMEKIAVNFSYDSDTQSLVLEYVDGTTETISLAEFITNNEFEDSNTVDFTVTEGIVKAEIKPGSITDDMLSSALLTALAGYVSSAAGSAQEAASSETNAGAYEQTASAAAQTATQKAKNAADSASDASSNANKSKSYAVGGTGTREGEDTDNAQYYYKQANLKSNDAQASAASAETSAEAALEKANIANDKAAVAQDSADMAKSYAIGGTGTRTGEDTDNAKYYKEQAEDSKTNAAESAQTSIQKAITATEKAAEASSSAAAAQSSAASASQSKAQAVSSAASAAASAKAAEEAKEQAEAIVGGDFATRATPAKVGNLAALTAEGNLSDSGKTADELDNIFIATYGTTTNEQMEQAYQAGKTLICESGAYIGYLTVRSASQHIFMSFLGGGMIALFMCNSNSWISGQLHIPTVAKSTTGNLAQLDADGNLVDSGKAIDDFADAAINTRTVRATNLSVPLSAWSQETSPTVTDYPWKAEIAVNGIDSTYKPSNLVSLTEGFMELLYEFANTGTNKLIIYASEKPATAATIDSVDFVKVVS